MAARDVADADPFADVVTLTVAEWRSRTVASAMVRLDIEGARPELSPWARRPKP